MLYYTIIKHNLLVLVMRDLENVDKNSKNPICSLIIHFILYLLSIISVFNISPSEATEHGLYDYWIYHVYRLIIIAIIFGIHTVISLILKNIDNDLINNLCIKISKFLCICYFISTLVLTYYLVATNYSAKTMSQNKTGNVYLDMIQNVTYIMMIMDYIITIPFGIGCVTIIITCIYECINECFCIENPIIIDICICLFNSIKLILISCKNIHKYIDSYKKKKKKEIKFSMMDGKKFTLIISLNQSIKEIKNIITKDEIELFMLEEEQSLQDDDILYDRLDILKTIDYQLFVLPKSKVTFNPVIKFKEQDNKKTKSKKKCRCLKQKIIHL